MKLYRYRKIKADLTLNRKNGQFVAWFRYAKSGIDSLLFVIDIIFRQKNVCYCDLVMDSLRFFFTNLNINKWWCFFCCLVLHKVFIGAISFIELKSVSILLSSLQSHDIQMEPSRYYKASILKSRNGKLLVKRILARVMSVRNGKRFVPVGSRNISIYHLFVVYTNLSNIISWKFIVCLRANKNGKRA